MYDKFHVTTLDRIRLGLFPLEDDTILKVHSNVGNQYFTCSEYDAASICLTLLKLLCVKSVEISSVYAFDDPYSVMYVTRETLSKLSKRFHKSE